jgi:thioredoxin 1
VVPSPSGKYRANANQKVPVSHQVIELTQINFDHEVIGAPNPVVVQAWASWSSPCHQMTPLLESVAGDRVRPVKVARLNVEQNEDLASQIGVNSVPTLLIFNLGRLQDQIVGLATEGQVRERLQRVSITQPEESPPRVSL